MKCFWHQEDEYLRRKFAKNVNIFVTKMKLIENDSLVDLPLVVDVQEGQVIRFRHLEFFASSVGILLTAFRPEENGRN